MINTTSISDNIIQQTWILTGRSRSWTNEIRKQINAIIKWWIVELCSVWISILRNRTVSSTKKIELCLGVKFIKELWHVRILRYKIANRIHSLVEFVKCLQLILEHQHAAKMQHYKTETERRTFTVGFSLNEKLRVANQQLS